MPAHAGRFADRVEAYTRGRPGYPDDAVDFLLRATRVAAESVVADIGSGTGLFTGSLLNRVRAAHAVEPDAGMRSAAEAVFGDRDGFHSVDGSAEETTLPDDSVDGLFVAQAFHWMDPERSAAEFRRILRQGAHVGLIWNRRVEGRDAFHEAYEALLRRWGTDYGEVRSRWESTAAMRVLWPGGWGHADFDNAQDLDADGLRARLVSSSYAPGEEHRDRVPMLEELRTLFDAHASDGRITLRYRTDVFFGRP